MRIPICLRPLLLLSGLLVSAAPQAVGATPLNTETREEKAEFNLLPRSFQRNPRVDQTVVTELTEEGRKLPVPSPATPAYYVAESGGFRSEGHGPDDRRLPSPDEIAATLQRALAVNGYLPATPEHPPAFLIVYYWGAHTALDGIPDIGHRNLLNRASLVGGARFAEELRQALQKQDRENEVNEKAPPELRLASHNFGPLRQFISRDTKTQQLWDACSDCYYAVASAYDYPAAQQGQRRLLWRTKMTLDSQGVAMRETLPGLIVSAGKYFGIDMPEAATMAKTLSRDGEVKLGPLEFKEYLKQPAPPPANEKTTDGRKP